MARGDDDHESALLAWSLAIVGALVACGVAGVVLFGGIIDIHEGNVAWLRAGPEYRPTGNLAVRTVWGVAAMVFSPMAFIYLAGLTGMRHRFAALTPLGRWVLAVAAPVVFVACVIALCAIGYYAEGPIVIPFPNKP